MSWVKVILLICFGIMNKSSLIGLPLNNPGILPWRSVKEIACSSALIVAPHPDDETLGCGGAIALLRSLNCRVQILVVSDGTLSHPHSQKYPADKLRGLREAETQSAMKLLNVEANAVSFLRMQDGSITTQYESAVASCRAYITEVAPEIIFLPWRYDPHADHRATWKLIKAALADLPLSPRLIEYPIWDWDWEQRGILPASLEVTTWRLDISTVVELKQQAIAAYRSQITDLIDDDPEGFRLSAEMLANFTHPWEVYIEENL